MPKKIVKVNAFQQTDLTATVCPQWGGKVENGICQLPPEFSDSKKVFGGFLGIGKDKDVRARFDAFTEQIRGYEVRNDVTECEVVMSSNDAGRTFAKINCNVINNFCKIADTQYSGNSKCYLSKKE